MFVFLYQRILLYFQATYILFYSLIYLRIRRFLFFPLSWNYTHVSKNMILPDLQPESKHWLAWKPKNLAISD